MCEQRNWNPLSRRVNGPTGELIVARYGYGLLALVGAWFHMSCAETNDGATWGGTIDTSASGLVQVSNPMTGLWNVETSLLVSEELRIGRSDGNGPDLFGRITDFAVDPAGRVYVFDGQAQELRVFDADGSYVRTVGRKGGGPGEFEQVIGMEWSPNGDLWLLDPSNNRISVIDTAGTYKTSHPALGGFVIMPWPGGFDDGGFLLQLWIGSRAGRRRLLPAGPGEVR